MRSDYSYVNIRTPLLEKVVKTYMNRRNKVLTSRAEVIRHICNFYILKCAEDTQDDDDI